MGPRPVFALITRENHQQQSSSVRAEIPRAMSADFSPRNWKLILANATIYAFAYCSLAHASKATWVVSAIAMALIFSLNKVSPFELLHDHLGFKSNAIKLVWTLFKGLLLIIIVREVLDNAKLYAGSDLQLVSIDRFIKRLLMVSIFFCLFIYGKRLTYFEAMVTLFIGVALVILVNLAADRLYSVEELSFGESRFEALELRWRPKLAASNSYFSMVCAVTIAQMIVCLRFLKVGRKIGTIGIVGAFVILGGASYAMIRLQFRVQLLPILLTIVMIFFNKHIVKGLVLALTIGAIFIFPIVFTSAAGQEFLQAIKLEKILEAMGSSTAVAETLSDRTLLWDYGWDRLKNGKTSLIGDGPVLRDASAAIDQIFPERYTMSFHSSLLESLVSEGIPIGTCLLIVVFLLAYYALSVANRRAENSGSYHLAFFTILGWLSLSFMDTGFAEFTNLLHATIPVFAILMHDKIHKQSGASLNKNVKPGEPS